MIQGNYFEDNGDLQFIVEHFIDWDTLIPLQEENFADAVAYKKNGQKALEFAPTNAAECFEGYRAV